MKRNSIMEESRKLITPEIKQSVDFSIDVANRIFDILEMKKMKQKDLANLMDKSEAEISKWLKGTHSFNVETILKIQSVLGEDIIQVVKTSKVVEIQNWTPPLTIVVSGKDTPTSNSNNVEEAA